MTVPSTDQNDLLQAPILPRHRRFRFIAGNRRRSRVGRTSRSMIVTQVLARGKRCRQTIPSSHDQQETLLHQATCKKCRTVLLPWPCPRLRCTSAVLIDSREGSKAVSTRFDKHRLFAFSFSSDDFAGLATCGSVTVRRRKAGAKKRRFTAPSGSCANQTVFQATDKRLGRCPRSWSPAGFPNWSRTCASSRAAAQRECFFHALGEQPGCSPGWRR